MNKYDQILMQYETPLPDDFDMDQVRNRVRKLAPQFDHYHGLGFKLYGVNDGFRAYLFAGSRFPSGKGYRRSVSQNRAW